MSVLALTVLKGFSDKLMSVRLTTAACRQKLHPWVCPSQAQTRDRAGTGVITAGLVEYNYNPLVDLSKSTPQSHLRKCSWFLGAV